MSRQRFWENVKYSLGDGRTLELDADPSVYLADDTLEAIKRVKTQGFQVCRSPGPVIKWPFLCSLGNVAVTKS